MSGFSLDFNEVYEGGGIKDGEYEVVVAGAKEDATPSGAEYMEFDLIIRNDVDQDHRNQHVFHKVWKSKATGKYNLKMINTIGKACQLENGKEYKSMQDLLDDFFHKTATVFVKNEESEYNGKTYNNLNVKRWGKTKFPNLQHQFKTDGNNAGNDPFAGDGKPIDIKDDDLPF